MELIAAGRDADVYALDGHRVLRRYRRPVDTAYEARVVAHLDEQGYPVPKVYDADGPEMILERLYGPLMFDVMIAKPWRLRRYVATLTDLLARLHAIPAPEWLATSLHDTEIDEGPSGRRVLHLDLHPLNVIMADRGPVVIDWTSAVAGDPAIDVAFTYLTLAASDIPATGVQLRIAETFRAALLRGLRSRWIDGVREVLARAAEIRAMNGNLSADEAFRVRRIAADLSQ